MKSLLIVVAMTASLVAGGTIVPTQPSVPTETCEPCGTCGA